MKELEDRRGLVTENSFSAASSRKRKKEMPTRGLTLGELQILDFVFYDTVDFERHEITTNDANVGGADNSVTYGDTPHYSNQIWCPDFSAPGAETWVFVHEFGHVWQYYYGIKPIIGWIYGAIKHGRDYEKNYPYDLTHSKNFKDYNIEQQASIVADYWAVNNYQPTRHCINPKSPQDSDYWNLMMQVQHAEKPVTF